jgi:hypothetical protein
MSMFAPLGVLVGARSGDKGGAANIGVWIPDPVEPTAVAVAWGGSADLSPTPEAVAQADARYAWLKSFLTVERLQQLLPETQSLTVERFEFENLRALNFLIHGLLGRGVAETSRIDPQAKGLGEHLRSRVVEMPRELLDE